MTESEIRADERNKIIQQLTVAWRKKCKVTWVSETSNLPPWVREVFGIEKVQPKHEDIALRPRSLETHAGQHGMMPTW